MLLQTMSKRHLIKSIGAFERTAPTSVKYIGANVDIYRIEIFKYCVSLFSNRLKCVMSVNLIPKLTFTACKKATFYCSIGRFYETRAMSFFPFILD